MDNDNNFNLSTLVNAYVENELKKSKNNVTLGDLHQSSQSILSAVNSVQNILNTANNTTDISTINSTVDTINTSLGTPLTSNETVFSVLGNISTNTTDISTINKNVDTINTNVDAINSTVDTINVNIGNSLDTSGTNTVFGLLNTIDSNLGKPSNGNTVFSVLETINNNTTDVTGINSTVDTINVNIGNSLDTSGTNTVFGLLNTIDSNLGKPSNGNTVFSLLETILTGISNIEKKNYNTILIQSSYFLNYSNDPTINIATMQGLNINRITTSINNNVVTVSLPSISYVNINIITIVYAYFSNPGNIGITINIKSTTLSNNFADINYLNNSLGNPGIYVADISNTNISVGQNVTYYNNRITLPQDTYTISVNVTGYNATYIPQIANLLITTEIY